MKVRILTPTDVVLEAEAVHVTAEDPTGSLGIRPGHVPLVTPLVPGIVLVRESGGGERFAAVNGGVMVVTGDAVDIVSRRAVAGTDVRRLEETALAEFEKDDSEAGTNRVAFDKMRLSFVRHVLEAQRAGKRR